MKWEEIKFICVNGFIYTCIPWQSGTNTENKEANK
jgi:hypothetical protein